MTTETRGWRVRGIVPRRSNFDRYSYWIVEEDRGDLIPPGMFNRYSVVARVQGESQEEADTRARLIVEAQEMANDARQVILLAKDAMRSLRMENERAEFDIRDARGFLMAIVDRHRALLRRLEGGE